MMTASINPKRKHKYLKCLTAAAILLAAAILWFAFISLALQHRSYAGRLPQQEIIVASGDTLWGIATRYGPDNEDPRSLVHQIQQLNRLEGGYIYPGQKLRLPW